MREGQRLEQWGHEPRKPPDTGRERTRQVDRPAWEKAERSNAGQCVHPVWALGQQKENEYSYAKE